MSKPIAAVMLCAFCVTSVAAQSEPPPAGSGSKNSAAVIQQATTSPATRAAQQNPADQPDQKEIEKIVFTHRSKLPDSPKPKTKGDENSGCPGGEGRPCALLGGRPYFRDQWHITEHEKTWWDAFKTPGMVFSTTTLFTAAVIDIEGTQHCLAAKACRELNPIIGKSRAQQYGIAMPMNALMTWVAVREKQHGRGVLPFFMMWTLSSVHLYYGVNGLTQTAAVRR